MDTKTDNCIRSPLALEAHDIFVVATLDEYCIGLGLLRRVICD